MYGNNTELLSFFQVAARFRNGQNPRQELEEGLRSGSTLSAPAGVYPTLSGPHHPYAGFKGYMPDLLAAAAASGGNAGKFLLTKPLQHQVKVRAS